MNKRPLVVDENPKSLASEAFRTLRTNLQFTAPDGNLKKIMVTSSGPAEGKSTVSANLAISICQSHRKVVLIDCDLRKPAVHEIFKLNNFRGLSSVITGQVSLADALQETSIEGLQVLTSGPTPPNPAELLQSQAMLQLIEELNEVEGMVLFDAPPVLPVADAMIIGPLSDGVVFVVAANQTPQDVVLRAKDLLTQSQINLLGVVLNRVNFKDSQQEYYYNYYNESI